MTTEYRLRHKDPDALREVCREDFIVERKEISWGWPGPRHKWVYVTDTKHGTLTSLERIARQDQTERQTREASRANAGKVVCTLTLSTSGAIVATP